MMKGQRVHMSASLHPTNWNVPLNKWYTHMYVEVYAVGACVTIKLS